MKTTVNQNNKNVLLGIIGLLWLLAVIIGYFYTHKPFSPNEIAGPLVAAWRIAIVLGLVTLAGGVGARILGGSAEQPLFQTAAQAALGLGILAILTLILGATVGLVDWIFVLLLIASGILLRDSIPDWWRSWRALASIWTLSGFFEKTIGVLLVLLLGNALIVSLAPPLAWDSLTYHIAVPRAFLLEGRITYLSENAFWGLSSLVEMLHTLVMLFGGNESAALLGWAIGLLSILGVFGFVNERFGPRAGWVAAACLLAGETLSASLAWGYTEWPAMLFGFAMLAALAEWVNTHSTKELLLAGIFAGSALGIKYTAGILVIAGIVVILSEIRTLRWWRTAVAVILFGLCVAAAMLPWLGKNFIATGNLFYPSFFPSGAMDQLRLDFLQKNTTSGTWIETIFLPWLATVWGVEGKVGFSASIGPLLLGLAPMAMIGWRDYTGQQKGAAKVATIVTCSGFIAWMIASREAGLLIQSRLYFAMFPAWAILGGLGFSSLGKLHAGGIRFGRLAAVLILLVVGFSTFDISLQTQRMSASEAILGQITNGEYHDRNLGWYAPAMRTVQELPPGSRVLLLWEPRSLHCLPICDPDDLIDQWLHDMNGYGSADEILQAWKTQGYTHLLLNRGGAMFARENETWYSDLDWEELDALLASLPEPMNFGESYFLYLLPGP